jgi:hypothetical protein
MNVLLLSLYYPPLNTIAASRMKAFETYLKQEGIDVTVVTRYYDEEQRKGNSMFVGSANPERFNEAYQIQGNVIYTNFKEQNPKRSFSQKLPPLIRGFYNYYHVDVFHYSWLLHVRALAEKELKHKQFDFIIASYGPPIVMLLAQQLSQTYSIPYLIDFRDNYITEADHGYQLWMKKRVQNRILKDAAGFLFSTQGMADYFFKQAGNELKKIPVNLVYNGVDETELPVPAEQDKAIVNQFLDIKAKSTLLLLHTGTLYNGQNIQFFIKGVQSYNEKYKQKIALCFVGLPENNLDELPRTDYIYQLPKVKHSTALYLQKNASALVLPIWDGRYTGFSGKTQEYMYSESLIITSPDPQEDLLDFFKISQNVISPKNSEQLHEVFSGIIKGSYKAKTLLQKEKLLRSYWIKQLANFLKTLKK